MYLSEVKLWNFRKYGIRGDDPDKPEPGLSLNLQPGLNVLIGENDSGKTTIIDAIRYTLGTQSREWIRYEDTDFHECDGIRSDTFKIECIFRGFNDTEAAPFLEWLGFEEINDKKEYVLTTRLSAQRRQDRIVTDLKAGPDEIGISIDGEARSRLRVTYLKPLRDAVNELTAGRRSRFAQILRSHRAFQKLVVDGEEQPHELEEIINDANEEISQYFKPDGEEKNDGKAGDLLRRINRYLSNFFAQGDEKTAHVEIAGTDLVNILQRLELTLEDNPAGLGALNLLYIAAELLLLHSGEFKGLRLAMIEELEAHLHPQAQIRLLHFLQNSNNSGQLILSTHSSLLGASIDLKKTIICIDDNVFPMGEEYTELLPKNYEFLQRFLDVTKANLFFARGVMIVEGDAENLLIPQIAKIIDRPLHKYGVSIVKVGSTAYSHYEKIFIRKDGQTMGIRVAVITDMDVKPLEWYSDKDAPLTAEEIEDAKEDKLEIKSIKYADPNVRRFISPNWTLEYEIALSKTRELLLKAILWSEKKQNAVSGIPKDEKEKEVEETAESEFARWETDWEEDERYCEIVAYEIFQKTLLDKRISKAIVAQEFAFLLSEIDPERARKCIIDSPSLSYLVDAICHVTKPIRKARRNAD